MKGILLTAMAALASMATAAKVWHLPADQASEALPPGVKNATFTQLIDHKNPHLGTFGQWYMYDLTYWKGPGSPVVFFTPGEVNASYYTNYLVTNRTTGVVAQEIGAATIVMEHRYWGYSSPYAELTTANLQYLTLENAIADFVRFAQTADLPFDKNHKSNAKNAPWLFMGASSAPVQAVSNYDGYFLPVELGMPKNCSKDVSLVIKYLDDKMKTGTAKEIAALKTEFGLQDVEHNVDFMSALENGPWLWQGNQFYETEGFYDWCDYVENAVGVTDPSKLPGPDGVGLQKALKGYAAWAKQYFTGFCAGSFGYFKGQQNMACFDTFNPKNPIFTDTSLANTGERQWTWMLCNEPFGYWQDGSGRASIVSSLVTPAYWTRQCGLYFPTGPNGETYGIAKGVTEAKVNAYTGGWEIDNSTHLVYTNGQFDPWREAGVSSDLRPDGPLKSTTKVPVNIVPGGFHTSDLVTQNGVVNAGCKKVIDSEVAQLVAWAKKWPGPSKPTPTAYPPRF